MSKWLMRGHFEHLHFETFPTILRTLQGKVFCLLVSSSEVAGVPEDSKSPLLRMWVSSSHFAQSGVVTTWSFSNIMDVEAPFQNLSYMALYQQHLLVLNKIVNYNFSTYTLMKTCTYGKLFNHSILQEWTRI